VRRILVLCGAVLGALGPSVAEARDATVRSFDGTPIVTHFFPAAGLGAGERAPTVLVGHGWGQQGETDPDARSEERFGQIGVGPLRRAGFNILTWDARGFGGSGGTVSVDAPDREARDVQALVDFVAAQPEALVDDAGARDPRVGMAGVSYAGGIQLTTAGIDRRLDAIVPIIAWHSLVSSLYKDQTVKGGWASVLVGAGVPASLAPGLLSPVGPQTGTLDPHILSAFASGAATGRIADEDVAWFASRGPGALVERIRIPTLLLQGTVDTLFTLQEAVVNHAILRRNGVPSRLVFFCGGHGVCLTERGEDGHLERAAVAWLRRWLMRDASVRVGPGFEWVDEEGRWRGADGYPVRATGSLTGTGSGTLPLTPGTTSGAAILATPSPVEVGVGVEAPGAEAFVLGEPRLSLTYRGTAAPAGTRVYAQLVDQASGRVLGNQVTPVPLTLDGTTRTVQRPLEAIASSVPPGARLRLQLVPGSNVYDVQRSAGAVAFARVRVELPVVDAAAFRRSEGSAGVPSGAPRPGARRPRRCTSRRVFTIRLRRGARRARVTVGGRRVRVRRWGGRRGRLVARVDLRGRRSGTVVVRIRTVLRGGRVVRSTRRYRTCTRARRQAGA